MLLNPTGGLVGGDHLRTEVTVRDGAHCCLTTPSPTKVYRTSGPAAVQEFSACLGQGAVLEYLPDHLILSPGAALRQSVSVDLAPESLLLLVDAFSVGRVARGERWEFREMVNSVTVQYKGEPLLMDRIRLSPRERSRDLLRGMEDFNYVATLSVLSDRPVRWELLADLLVKRLEECPSVQGGVSLLSRHGLLIRLLTVTAYHLQEAIRHLWAAARGSLLGLPPINLRKF